MTKRSIEFHDSTFTDIRADETGNIEIILNKAVIHESLHNPGSESGKVSTQQVKIIITSPKIEQNSSQREIDIYDGWISIDDEKYDHVFPLPLKRSGQVKIMLALAWDNEKILINGTAVEVIPVGTPEYLEEFN